MIDSTHIEGARSIIAAQGVGEAAVEAMRKQWPNCRFAYCSDDDVPPRLEPVGSGEGYALYLIAGSEHCLSLTKDPANAIGLVLAQVEADD